MGADKPKFALPQATETDSATGVSSELGTQVTEKTSYSLQEGNAVTIPTKGRRKHKELNGANSSRASLLIEYFQGGAGSQIDSKPSVRVKVQRPSSNSRSRNDFVEITESKTARKPSYTKRIQLEGPKSPEREGDEHSLHSYRSATEESNVTSNVTSRGGGPIEIEVMPRRHGSPLIPTGESSSKYLQQGSDISSMPPDSFLDNTRTERSERITQPGRRSRSRSRERIIIKKVVDKAREEKQPERRRKHRSRSRSVSTEQIKSPRRRSHHESSLGGDSSLLSSNISSGKSSSINNPKLLEMVETTIKRLILPELEAIKRENSKHHQHRRSSITSGSAISRDSRDESLSTRRSDRESGTDLSGKPRMVLNDSEVISERSARNRKDKNLDRVKLEDSPRSFERETSEDTVVQDEHLRKKRSGDHRGLKNAALGLGAGALTVAALQKHQSQESVDEKKERRRRRTKSQSRSDLAESVEEQKLEIFAPPMPLMSDINASEITRSSILSANTERPHSASQERHVTPIREVARGFASPASRTPTRTPVQLQQGLGTQHSNFSRGNLSLHSQPSEQQLRTQEYDLDEHGRKIPFHDTHEDEYDDSFVEEEHNGSTSRDLAAAAGGAVDGAGLATALQNKNHSGDSDLREEEEDLRYYQNNQEVPPPLRYVPYAAERRGLSPIQSVSGYTEGDPDPRQRDSRLTHSTGSYSSLSKSFRQEQEQSGRSLRSEGSIGNVHNRHDFAEVRQGGLTDSELTQDGEYWEEQHRENDRNRDIDADSYRSSDPRYSKRMTDYTDDRSEVSELDRVATGQNVRGIGANPDYVHTPLAVESAVASLINESDLTGSALSGNNGNFDRRGSYASFDGGEERNFTSRGSSPRKQDARRKLSFEQSDRGSSRQQSPEKYTEEFDLDEHGRKVAMPGQKTSHIVAKAGLAGIAAGAAAAVIAGRNKKSADQIHFEEREEHTGAPLQRSFKERALEGHGMPSPRHSVDALSQGASQEQLRMGASGLPDLSDPMPEIGYGDGDSDITNPSIIQGPIGGKQVEATEQWSRHSTPQAARSAGTPIRQRDSDANLKAAEVAFIGAAAATGGAAALASHSRNASHDSGEWQRTSREQKRDTLITNPYEDTSPIAAIGGLDRDLLGESGYTGMNNTFSPTGFQTGRLASPKDEGYISSAPNNARSPGAISPERRTKGVGFLDQDLGDATDALGGGDPFYTPKHNRHLSGMSHGMDSPVYDSATGNGIDRIQSKDIVALMDHLTVRDAQRSARDTEILVTLVRAAAEMRNSFEDMKRLLADTEDVIITEVQTNTDKSIQKVINGPRPLPPSAARSLRQGSQDDVYEDIPTKRRNVFRRALKGLSMRSSNDLGKIEEMLVQLLGEVEGLKVAQGLKQDSHEESYDDLHQEGNYENDGGYEPEGHAGTSTASHASQSGHLSIPRGPSATRGFDGRKFSDHRISTVPEGDEEELDRREEEILNNQFENNEQLLTPTREISRSDSVPLDTPPQQNLGHASYSNENTPKTDKSKKHKSSSSSGWIPKVSRWSETTASTVLRGFRSSGRSSGKKGDEHYEPPSRSASDLGHYAENDPYDDENRYSPDHDDRFQENEPLESLPPPEDPKYKAHRDSLNLQHPQPRPGPTHRYQTALEVQAQDFDSPMSPRSVEWGASQTSLNRLPAQQTNRYSNTTNNTNPGNLSPASDGAYSNQGPERPPKEPLAPERPPKVRSANGKLQKPSPLSNEHLQVDDDRYSASYEPTTAPRSAPRSTSGTLGAVPTRKPTGPRSMSSASRSGELSQKELLQKDSGSVRRNKNRGTHI